MADTQRFHADEANASNDFVLQMRKILDGAPIAVAQAAADTLRDDVHRQLQFGKAQFIAPQ